MLESEVGENRGSEGITHTTKAGVLDRGHIWCEDAARRQPVACLGGCRCGAGQKRREQVGIDNIRGQRGLRGVSS